MKDCKSNTKAYGKIPCITNIGRLRKKIYHHKQNISGKTAWKQWPMSRNKQELAPCRQSKNGGGGTS